MKDKMKYYTLLNNTAKKHAYIMESCKCLKSDLYAIKRFVEETFYPFTVYHHVATNLCNCILRDI